MFRMYENFAKVRLTCTSYLNLMNKISISKDFYLEFKLFRVN